MKEKGKVLFIVLIFSGILVLLGLLLFRRSGQDSFTTKNEESKAVNGMDLVTDSRFIEYTPDVIESNKDKRRILYFYANWCPICRPADAEFKANQGRIPEGVVVIRINYNDSDTDSEEEGLAQEYGITYQHTFVEIDSSGQEVQKWNGGGVEELLERL